MNPRTSATLAVLALAATAVAVEATPGGAQDPTTTTLSFRQKDALDHLVDAPPKGGERTWPSAGDTHYASHNLLDPVSGARRGRSYAICGVTVPGHRYAGLCGGVIVLPEGTITLAAGFSGAPKVRAAVTGGTGRYAGARGTATITDNGRAATTWQITLLD